MLASRVVHDSRKVLEMRHILAQLAARMQADRLQRDHSVHEVRPRVQELRGANLHSSSQLLDIPVRLSDNHGHIQSIRNQTQAIPRLSGHRTSQTTTSRLLKFIKLVTLFVHYLLIMFSCFRKSNLSLLILFYYNFVL